MDEHSTRGHQMRHILIRPVDLLVEPILRIRVGELDPSPHLRVFLSVTSMDARDDLDSAKAVFPEIPGDERRFTRLTFHVSGGEVARGGSLGASSEPNVVRREEGFGVHHGDAVPPGEDLEREESVEALFRGRVVDEQLEV